MKNLFSGFIFILFFGLNVYSQEENKNITKIKVFETSSTNKKVSSSYKWSVKTDLVSALTGDYPIIGEFRIAKSLSIEGSAGFTYQLFKIGKDDRDSGETKPNIPTDFTLDAETPEIGTSFRGAVKYYVSSDYDAIEGYYIGVQILRRDIKYSYSKNDSAFNPDGKFDIKTKTGISLIAGSQFFYSSNVLLDIYFGIGIAKIERSFLSENLTTKMFNNNTYEKTLPNFQLGLRIGFGN